MKNIIINYCFIILLNLLIISKIVHSFEFKKCYTNSDIISINDFDIQPDPLVIPGKFKIKLSFEIKNKLNDGIEIKTDVKRYTSLFGETFKVPVPCINNIGSCTYNFCELLSKLNPIVNVKCPLEIGKYGSNVYKDINLPSFDMLYEFNEAKYDIEIQAFDGDKKIGCLLFSTTIKVPE